MNIRMDIKEVERISKALGDPYRLKIVEAISKKKGFMQCSDIVDMFGLAQSTISHHLKQLTDAELIISEKDGRQMRYEINKDVFSAYLNFLNPLAV